MTVEDMSPDQLEIVWEIHGMERRRLASEEQPTDTEERLDEPDPPRDAELEEANERPTKSRIERESDD